jgi:hypothetical protein
MPKLSLSDAIQLAKRGRKLLRAGRITHRQYIVLDCLLWCCRNPVTGAIVVSYTALQRLCHVSRETIAGAVKLLGRLGVLTKIKRRVRLLWHHGGTASRQLTNSYVLHPGTNTEFGGATVIQLSIEKKAAFEGVRAASAGPDLLLMRRQAMAARFAVCAS